MEAWKVTDFRLILGKKKEGLFIKSRIARSSEMLKCVLDDTVRAFAAICYSRLYFLVFFSF